MLRHGSPHRLAYTALVAVGFLALLLYASTAGARTTHARSTAATTLRVAVYNNFPPDAYTKNGKLVGWIPDLVAALQKPAGMKFKVVQVNQFDGLIPGLQSGRYDMAPDTFYITPERLKVVDMVTMSQVGTSFGANKTNPVIVKGATGICGHKIAALAGSVFPAQVDQLNKKCVAAGKAKATTQVYPDDASAVQSVITGRNDLYAGATDQVAFLQQTGKLSAQPFAYQKQLEAIAFPKGSANAAVIQKAMNKLIKSGQYGRILAKWGIKSMAISRSVVKRAG